MTPVRRYLNVIDVLQNINCLTITAKKERKKSPTFNISGVTVTAQAVLKAMQDLEVLDNIIPKNREEKKR